MERLRQLIKEVLSTPPKKDSCNCGCHDCDNVGNTGVVLNESLVKKEILSENLRYHVDNKLPLTENTFRYGSKAFLNLWSEARYLYLREIIHVNDDDKEILLETDLGEYGMYENQRVPLGLPMMEESENNSYIIKFGFNDDGEYRVVNSKPISAQSEEEASEKLRDQFESYEGIPIEIISIEQSGLNEEDKKKTPPIGKPKRGGSKKFYVYVKNKGKVKKVSFGQVGMSAKINDPKARRAFAARHDCKNKTDRTKPSYWSCRLPRYSKLLGLKSSFSGFW
jgi:hypothetical protein